MAHIDPEAGHKAVDFLRDLQKAHGAQEPDQDVAGHGLPPGGADLDYSCPCQKDFGFFFLPVSTAGKLMEIGTASEMDAVLDLWISAIYQDDPVAGSDLGPVAYFRNGTGSPLVSYTELAQRWGHSRSTVGRMLKRLSDAGYLELMSFPGRSGSVIYLKNYLSTMFQISDVLVNKDEVALRLYIVLR